mgnify:CR=1 FL=1
MSGIAGIYHLDGRPVDEEIDRMVGAMEHRGPDGIHTWREGPVGLGHCLLQTTPEDRYESLPLVDRTGSYVVTADARIDNRRALIGTLTPPAPDGRPVTDTEIILEAYKRWGRDCPKKLLGAFSFCVWDAREQYLFCARDHFGVKPLYYCQLHEQLFAVASEVKSLLQIEAVPQTLNEMRIADQLGYFGGDKESTYFKSIRRIPPAHAKTVGKAQSDSIEYWSLDPGRTLNLDSREDYAEAFRELFTTAVSDRMRSQAPIGCMLSGGLDSSSVACAAHQVRDKQADDRIRTISCVFDETPESDEREYISAVLEAHDFAHTSFRGDSINPIYPFLDTLSGALDIPLRGGGNLYVQHKAYDILQSDGARVVLSGFDGDSTVSHGFGRLRELAEAGRWFSFARVVRAYAQNMGTSACEIARPYLIHFVAGPVVSRIPGYQRLRNATRGILGDGEEDGTFIDQDDLLDSDFADRSGWTERKRSILKEARKNTTGQRDLQHRRLTGGGIVAALEETERTAALVGIEARFPFWDRRLVEFCLAAPPELKLGKGWTRRIHRLGTDGILPEKIRWRRDKGNLGHAFRRQLVDANAGRLSELLSRPLRIRDYVNVDTVRKCCDSALDSGQTTSVEAHHLWNVLTLELWLRRFEEG